MSKVHIIIPVCAEVHIGVCVEWLGLLGVCGLLVDMGVGWGRHVRWGCGLCGWKRGWTE